MLRVSSQHDGLESCLVGFLHAPFPPFVPQQFETGAGASLRQQDLVVDDAIAKRALHRMQHKHSGWSATKAEHKTRKIRPIIIYYIRWQRDGGDFAR